MDRKRFLRTLIGGAAVAVVAPSLLTAGRQGAVEPVSDGIRVQGIIDSHCADGISFNIPYKQFTAEEMAVLMKYYSRGFGLHEIISSL